MLNYALKDRDQRIQWPMRKDVKGGLGGSKNMILTWISNDHEVRVAILIHVSGVSESDSIVVISFGFFFLSPKLPCLKKKNAHNAPRDPSELITSASSYPSILSIYHFFISSPSTSYNYLFAMSTNSYSNANLFSVKGKVCPAHIDVADHYRLPS